MCDTAYGLCPHGHNDLVTQPSKSESNKPGTQPMHPVHPTPSPSLKLKLTVITLLSHPWLTQTPHANLKLPSSSLNQPLISPSLNSPES